MIKSNGLHYSKISSQSHISIVVTVANYDMQLLYCTSKQKYISHCNGYSVKKEDSKIHLNSFFKKGYASKTSLQIEVQC